VVGTLLGSVVAVIASAQPASAAICSGSLQAKLDAAPAGATVTADACIYREQVSITKPLTLVGQTGSEIRGSNVWGEWTKLTSGNFRSSGSLPAFPQEDVSCEPDTQQCAWPEQVFIDGTPQQQVGPRSDPGAGQFKVNTSKNVVLGSNPRYKTVEVTVRRHWITGSSSADGVTIRNFTMRHAANEWRSGAIQSRPLTTQNVDGTYAWARFKGDGDDWNVRDNVLLHAHGAILSVRSRNADVIGNEIAYGGQLGVHNLGHYSLLANNQIHHNNTERFCIAAGNCVGYSTDGDSTLPSSNVIANLVESGGVKIAGGQRSVTVDHNKIYDNRGQGLWFDVGTYDITASNNRIHHNARRGLFFEISDGATIFGNVIWENGWATPGHVDGAGIQIGNSRNVEVYGNTLAWNADGIAVVGLDREGTEYDAVTNVHVHDNTILQEDTDYPNDSKTVALGWIQGWTTQMFQSTANNSGKNNLYYYPIPEEKPRYEWDRTRYSSLVSFNSTLGEENGRYLRNGEKDMVAADKHIPANPEPH